MNSYTPFIQEIVCVGLKSFCNHKFCAFNDNTIQSKYHSSDEVFEEQDFELY